MKSRRDLFILGGLFLALILFVALGPSLRPNTNNSQDGTTHSSENGGALALYNWLNEIGYDARRLEYRSFELDEKDAALVLLNPSEPVSQTNADTMLDWVERGGTLIFADDSSIAFGGANALLDTLRVDRQIYTDTASIERAAIAQPVLDQPPARDALVKTGRILVPQDSNYVKLLGTRDANILIGIKRGRGYIYLSSATYPFTNAGLRDEANATLVLNLLRRVPGGGRVLFDEYHHGYFTPPSTGRTVLSSPLGWAAAYAMLAVGLYLLLSGRRFGRPVPLKEETVRRSSAEYVESMADLFQRGGQRAYMLRHYYTAFKRRLAAPAGINPQLDDKAFVRELARFREVDEAALLDLLARLRNERLGEAELVRVVAEAETYV